VPKKWLLTVAAALVTATLAAAAAAAVAPFRITFSQEPPASSDSATAVFDFSTNRSPVSYECFLDGSASPAPSCTPPVTYNSLSNGQHTFSVVATYTDPTSGQESNTKEARSWTVRAAPDTLIEQHPPAQTEETSASFSFVSAPTGASFECALDSSGFDACSSPQSYDNLAVGQHSFQVRALSDDLIDSSPASVSWTIKAVTPITFNTVLTKQPHSNTETTQATFSFISDPAGASFECALDSSGFVPCVSPKSYADLSDGKHSFRVRADSGSQHDASPATAAWTIQASSAGGGGSTGGGSNHLWLVLGGLLLGLGLALAVAGTLRWRHVRLLRRRGAWQLEASDDELPRTCRVPQQYTWRRECTATPSLWKVESLTLADSSGTEDSDKHEIAADSAVVRVNDALQARRTRSAEGRMREILRPVAEHLGSEVEEWLAKQQPSRTVEIFAKLSGCEFECEFTHFQCAPDQGANHWQKRDAWKGKVESTATVPVAIVARPQAGTEPGAAVDCDQLEADLLSFVRRVDIPWKMRTLERQITA
jgi:hypothetical protein